MAWVQGHKVFPAQRQKNNDLLKQHPSHVVFLWIQGEKWIWHFIDCSPLILQRIEPSVILIRHLALSSTGLVADRWETSFFCPMKVMKQFSGEWATIGATCIACVVGHKMIGYVLIWQAILLMIHGTSAVLTHLDKIYIISVWNPKQTNRGMDYAASFTSINQLF